jgi:hypothetical protein
MSDYLSTQNRLWRDFYSVFTGNGGDVLRWVGEDGV